MEKDIEPTTVYIYYSYKCITPAIRLQLFVKVTIHYCHSQYLETFFNKQHLELIEKDELSFVRMFQNFVFICSEMKANILKIPRKSC